MFNTPYQTTPCSRFPLDKTAAGIRKLEINEQLVHPEGSPPGVMFIPAGAGDFPPFLQPMTRNEVPNMQAEIVIDGRSLLKADGKPSRTDLFKHHCLTADLVKNWYGLGDSFKKDLLNVSEFPGKVFISWVSSAITVRLGLDFGQVSVLRILCAIYYLQLFKPLSDHPTHDELDRLLVRASRLIPGSSPTVLADMFPKIPSLNNIQDFVDWVKVALDTPRTESMTVPLLYVSLGYSWGPAFRESVAVALEYPPVFFALVYTSIQERSYVKTGLGQVVERTAYRGSERDYVKNLNHLLARK